MNYPKKNALVLIDESLQSTEISYRQLYEDVASCAQSIQSMRLPKEATILIQSIMTYEFFVVYFASIAAGMRVIASLSELTVKEIDYIIKESQSLFYFKSKHIKGLTSLPSECHLIDEDIIHQWIQKSAPLLNCVTRKKDPAIIVFTSGSTANPKGVIHSHDVVLGRELIRRYWLGMTANDRVLVTGKPCWTYSMGVGFFDTFASGATAIVYLGNDIEAWYPIIDSYQVTLFASSPIYFKKLIQQQHEKYNLSSLRQVISAGEVLPQKVVDHWYNQIRIPIYEALGMTELSTFISSGPSIPLKKGYVGQIQPGRRIAILPIEKGEQPVGINEVGLLAIHRGCPGFMLSYINQDDNAQANFRGPWFITGDVVCQNQDGYIQYCGRADDVLNIKGGHRISPLEVEAILITHPDILDVACGVTKDKNQDNILTAFIVSDLTVDVLDIPGFLEDKLSPRKIPKVITIIDHLPRNSNGKIDRKRLTKLGVSQDQAK